MSPATSAANAASAVNSFSCWISSDAGADPRRQQNVLAAEVTVSSPDFGQLQPMVEATNRELEAIGITETPGVAVADTGYWHEDQIDNVVSNGTQVLIPPDAGKRDTPRPDGRAGATRGCATCSPPTKAAGSTEDAKRSSSPCSPKPNTTAGSTASSDEEDRRCARNGG